VRGKIHSGLENYTYFWDLNRPDVKLCQRCSVVLQRAVQHEEKCTRKDPSEAVRTTWEEFGVDAYPIFDDDDTMDEKIIV